MIRDDVGNITAAVEEVLPRNSGVDISALTDARGQLSQVYDDIEEQQSNVDDYTDVLQIIIIVLGAAAFVLGIWGLVTLLVRVRVVYLFIVIYLLGGVAVPASGGVMRGATALCR